MFVTLYNKEPIIDTNDTFGAVPGILIKNRLIVSSEFKEKNHLSYFDIFLITCDFTISLLL